MDGSICHLLFWHLPLFFLTDVVRFLALTTTLAMRDARDARARRTVVQSYSRGASGGFAELGMDFVCPSRTVEARQVVPWSSEWISSVLVGQ